MNSFKPNPNYNIEVFDQVLSFTKIRQIYDFFKIQSYYASNFDNGSYEDSIKPKFSKYFFSEQYSLDLKDNPIIFEFLNSVNLILKKELDFSLFKSMQVNLSDSSTIDLLHADDFEYFDKISYTILYYGNIKWDINYGGETLFYNPNNLEIISAIQPKPGRFVIFDSCIPHSARSPQVHCPFLRYTAAVKTHPI